MITNVISDKIQSALNYEDLEEINECCCLIKGTCSLILINFW